MPYRSASTDGYSLLRELPDSARPTCAMLLWEMIGRDRLSGQQLDELLRRAGADDEFRRALDTVRRVFERPNAASKWKQMVASYIEDLDDRDAQETIYAFLFEVASVAAITSEEATLLARLRIAWRLTEQYK